MYIIIYKKRIFQRIIKLLHRFKRLSIIDVGGVVVVVFAAVNNDNDDYEDDSWRQWRWCILSNV